MRFDTLKRKKYIRRTLLGLLVFLTAMAQNVPWLPGIFGGRALPLLPLTVAIAVLDREIAAMLLGALAGLLWDLVTPGFPWNALYLTAVAFACAMLMRYVLNRNWLTVSLLTLLTSAGHFLLRWAIDFHGYEGAAHALLRCTLPGLAYTLLLAPLCYALVLAIVRRTSRKQRGVLAE